ncbi:ankyrin repeat-containing domain protein [Cadophora sp. MPI-SDFR-AT-0126]|nr:ankyrin repeat-containing domain protein [Leotiomycetes sp. MPI-SDFR-AT-0126]
MSSTLELLVPELLDLILENLERKNKTLSHLMRCSKFLHNRLQPILYGSPKSLEQAMRRACKTGNTQTIRLASSYGANVGLVDARYNCCSTLKLAAERGHAEAFDLLLEMGATFDHPNVTLSPRFSRKLCSPVREAVLFSFLKAGFASLRTIELSLPSVIRTGGSPELVRALLDHGVDVNTHERLYGPKQHHIIATPLSTAILENRMSIFDVLIEKGADINGTEHCNPFHRQTPYPFRQPLHLPIYAAAISMAKHGMTAMMERCLDLGADINFISRNREHPAAFAVLTTPILTYLSAIKQWDEDAKLHPLDGLQFFLRHQAELEIPLNFKKPGLEKEYVQTESTVEVLLDKWGINKLGNPHFFATIEFLIDKGAGKDTFNRILTKYKTAGEVVPLGLPQNWTRLANLFIKRYCSGTDPTIKNTLLRTVLRRYPPHDFGGFHDIDRCTVRSVIAAGADINAHNGGSTILHEICGHRDLATFSHICGHEDISACGYVRRMCSFFTFLHDIGADPRIVINGKSPIDVLLGPTQQSFRISESGEKYLVRLGNILLGELDKYSLSDLKSLDVVSNSGNVQNLVCGRSA